MDLKLILEAILFSAPKPFSAAELRNLLARAAEATTEDAVRAFKKVPLEELETALAQLETEHAAAGRSFRVVCVAGAWQFVSQSEFAPWVRAVAGEKTRAGRLSAPALETLAIVAYRQPITRAEIEQIRGVSVDGVMQTLLERGLVESVGRAEVVGRPVTYGTTKAFLEYFGLPDLAGLPAADELRRIPVERPAALLTVDPGLVTAPPEQLLLPGAASATPPAAAEAATPAAPAPADAPGATPEAPVAPTERPSVAAPEPADAGPAESAASSAP